MDFTGRDAQTIAHTIKRETKNDTDGWILVPTRSRLNFSPLILCKAMQMKVTIVLVPPIKMRSTPRDIIWFHEWSRWFHMLHCELVRKVISKDLKPMFWQWPELAWNKHEFQTNYWISGCAQARDWSCFCCWKINLRKIRWAQNISGYSIQIHACSHGRQTSVYQWEPC